MKVFDGTQSESTHAPPAPVGLDDGDLGVELRGDQRRLVPGRPATDDHDPAHDARDLQCSRRRFVPQTCRHAPSYSPPPAGAGYRHRRASLRRVRLEPGPGPHAGLLPAFADGRHRLAGRLAADLRRRGPPRLGGRGHHDRRVARRPGLRRALRRAPAGRAAARRGRGRRPRARTSKLHLRVATLDGEVTAWVYVFDGYEGGLPTAWYLSEIANAARRPARPTTTSPSCARPPAPRRLRDRRPASRPPVAPTRSGRHATVGARQMAAYTSSYMSTAHSRSPTDGRAGAARSGWPGRPRGRRWPALRRVGGERRCSSAAPTPRRRYSAAARPGSSPSPRCRSSAWSDDCRTPAGSRRPRPTNHSSQAMLGWPPAGARQSS